MDPFLSLKDLAYQLCGSFERHNRPVRPQLRIERLLINYRDTHLPCFPSYHIQRFLKAGQMSKKGSLPALQYAIVVAVAFYSVLVVTFFVVSSSRGLSFSHTKHHVPHSVSSRPGCSGNGCPTWPNSNVTAAVTSQQLPRTVVDLVKTHRQTSWVNLADVIAATQSPDSLATGFQTLEQICQSQKYLVVDDISTVSGLGFSMITMVPISLQALVQGRILVHASSFIQGAKWSWCQEPPHSVDCYYRPWTSCIPYLRSLLINQEDMWDLPSWQGNNASAPMTAWSQHGPHADTRDSAFYWGNPHFLQPGAASTLWWYSLFMRQYFSPSPAMEAEAVDFLRSSGLQPWDSFIVINVRHGSKGTEQKVVQPEEFIQPLKQMSACLGTRHVYLVTETKAVAERMLALGKQHGFNIFTVEYNYPGVDTWNPNIMRTQGQNISQAGLREIGYVSAKVLAVTRLGTGFIGTLQSAWAKVSVAAMYGYHGRPVPTLSLRPTWALEKGYVGWDRGWLSQNGSMGHTQPWPCV